MTDQERYDTLDRAIDALILRGATGPTGDAALDAMARVAAGLRGLPNPDFKARLRAELFPAPVRRRWLPSIWRSTVTALIERLTVRPRIAVPLAFATAAVAAALIAVLVLSPFGERAAEEEFGLLPPPAGGGKGGGVVEPSGTITWSLSPELSLPASALAYRLRPPQVTAESVAEIARRLGIEGPAEFTPAEDDGGKGGGIPARYRVASGGRSFEMLADGTFSYQDDALSGDVKHTPPDAQAPTEDQALAAAEDWLRLTGLSGDDPYVLAVGEPSGGSRDVTVTPTRPANQILDHPSIYLLVTSDGIAQVSGYWPSIDAESPYPLHSAEQLLSDLRDLRGEFNLLEPLGGKDAPPMGADRLKDASATVESVELGYSRGIAADGQPFLVPLYIVRGHLTQPGLAEPDAFTTWVPATDTAPRPAAEEPEPPADLIAVRDSLPLPADATVRAPIGPLGLQTSYFVSEEQDAVVEFYQRELPAQGWQLEDAPPPQWSIETLGAQFTSVSSFVKGDVRVVVLVGPNEKDASRGATLFDVVVELRS